MNKKTTKATKPKPEEKAIIYGLYDEGRLLYVGSTNNATKRYKEHVELLLRKKKPTGHTNKTLQKYCDDNKVIPTMEILHTCKDDTRIRKWMAELICIDLYRPKCNKPILQTSFGRHTNLGFAKVPFDKQILDYL